MFGKKFRMRIVSPLSDWREPRWGMRDPSTEPGADFGMNEVNGTSEVIRMWMGHPRIVSVTPQRVVYIDMEGREQFIDLEECAKNWVSWFDNHREEFVLLPGATEQSSGEWNARCVGKRGALDDPPWAEFMNDRKTCFEFETLEALCEELLDPLLRAGWDTFDCN